jgi:hypothetical protein
VKLHQKEVGLVIAPPSTLDKDLHSHHHIHPPTSSVDEDEPTTVELLLTVSPEPTVMETSPLVPDPEKPNEIENEATIAECGNPCAQRQAAASTNFFQAINLSLW